MIELDDRLVRRLSARRVVVQSPDADTIVLQRVPANHRRFNKPRTNLLIKVRAPGQPLLVCVDEDLRYEGGDASLARTFATGPAREGWRALVLGARMPSDPNKAVEHALGALGFDGSEPAPPFDGPPEVVPGGLLATAGADMTALVASGREPSIGRADVVTAILATLGQCDGRLPLVMGPPGVGKTNLVAALAAALAAGEPPARLIRVDLACLMAGTFSPADRDRVLDVLLRESIAVRSTVVALEALDVALFHSVRGQSLLAWAVDAGARLVGTTTFALRDHFRDAPIGRRLQLLPLDEFEVPLALEAVAAHAPRLGSHHVVRIDEAMVDAAVRRSTMLVGRLPAKAVQLLDAAAARAALRGAAALDLEDLYLAATGFPQADETH